MPVHTFPNPNRCVRCTLARAPSIKPYNLVINSRRAKGKKEPTRQAKIKIKDTIVKLTWVQKEENKRESEKAG